jgi:hypothetical protein
MNRNLLCNSSTTCKIISKSFKQTGPLGTYLSKKAGCGSLSAHSPTRVRYYLRTKYEFAISRFTKNVAMKWYYKSEIVAGCFINYFDIYINLLCVSVDKALKIGL